MYGPPANAASDAEFATPAMGSGQDGGPAAAVRGAVRPRARRGAGAVREVCELIMAAQGTLEARIAPYLR